MKNPRMTRLAMFLMLFTTVIVPRALAAENDSSKFIRFVDDNNGGGKLQTAIVTYTNKAGVKVHLVAAVHVADEKYYTGLQKTFAGYDALLYEMVKPAGMGAPIRGQHSDSMISFIQTTLKDVLDLDYQLDAIDYTKKNFVHADLTAEQFEKLQAERGENMFTIILRQMLNEMGKERSDSGISDLTMAELLVALTSPDSSRHLKLMLAKQFGDVEDQIAGMEGPGGSVILTERNKMALKAVKAALAKGDKNFGVFFGAAHMKGISAGLEKLGFSESGAEWRTAWDMTARPGDIIVKQVPAKEKK